MRRRRHRPSDDGKVYTMQFEAAAAACLIHARSTAHASI